MGLINPRHTIQAAVYSWEGLVHGLKNEKALVHIILILVVLVGLLCWFQTLPFMLMVLGWCFLLSVELINTAIERICDLVSPEHNLLVKQAKDLGAAASAVVEVANVSFWFWLAITHFIL